MPPSNCELVTSVIEEIALEGLDGITLQALWIRLSERPGLHIDLDSYTKLYIWNLVKRLKDVEFFELSVPRNDLVIFNRFDYVDAEMGTVVDPEVEPEDIYPYYAVDDTITGNRGSCSNYNERISVTDIAKTLSLEEAETRWGSKLVIVANQRTRSNALQGDNIDPLMELTLIQYCLLERIGRARYHGEVTIGKVSLQKIGIDAKSLFYLRKYLRNHKLITKQIYHLKSGHQNTSGSLLHITRFYVLRRPKVLILTQKVVEILKGRPGNIAEYEEIRQYLGLYYSLKKLMKTSEFQRLIKTDLKLPYRKVYPEAKQSEWKLKGHDKEKMVRVIQLIKPDVDVEEIWSKEDDDEDDIYSGNLDQSKLLLDMPLLNQAYDVLYGAGPKGLSQMEIGVIMGQTRLESRNICRNLVKCGLVSMYMQDVGRQRVTRFMVKKFSSQGEMSLQYEREKQKMMELLSIKPDVEGNTAKPDKRNDQDTTLTLNLNDEKDKSRSFEDVPKDYLCGEKIETEVVEDVVETSKTNVYSGFQQEFTLSRVDVKKEGRWMTYRLLKRANLIMECIKSHKVIYDCKKLMQLINDEEEKEGYRVKIDKKTLLRLLSKLKRDGHIKYIRITLRMKNNVRGLTFICEPSVTKDDPVIQSSVEQAKVKFFVRQKENSNSNTDESSEKPGTKTTKEKRKDPANKEGKITIIYNKSGKMYGVSPKFVRMKLLHKFLFYLIYGYEGEEGLDQSKLVEQLILSGSDLDPELSKELPTIFYPTICWKTFVPSLPKHLGFPEGWTFMSDWLLRIPLSLFVKIFNITYWVPSLEDYLNHPIRQHYLINSLPSKLRRYIFMGRRYIFSIHEIVCRLCYIGLVQFGPQRLKEKDQVFIFLNRKASLLDTTPSMPGYHQVSADVKYEELKYNFGSMSDVDKYWYDMWNICIKTQLGGRMCVTGNNITLESLNNKEAMIQATNPRNPEEAPLLDTGFVPGDHRGAAGLDSAIFSHLKRNWNSNSLASKKGYTKKLESQNPDDVPLRAAKFAKLKQKKEKLDIIEQMTNATKISKPRNKLHNKISGVQRKRTISTSVQNLCKKKLEKAKHVVRKVLPRKTRRPRPYYDEEDRKALAKMKKLRVDWSEKEDALLLTCKVAGMYFFPTPRNVTITFQAIRDVLHKTFKESKNKTSRACQRRIQYVMKNPATAHSVALSLLDLKHDKSINERFEDVIKKAKAAAKCREHLEKLLRPAFGELVEILTKRNESAPKPTKCPTLLQGSIDDLRAKYSIAFPYTLEGKSQFHDVANTDDILKTVLHSVIHSSFCCSADKTSWAFQLFKVYQQYPDSFLKSSMNKFRSDQMVTLKKHFSKSAYKSGNFLPISSCPYKLSMNYAYLFQTEYQFDIFQQAYLMMKNLEQEGKAEQKTGNLNVTTSDGGGAAAIFELFSKQKINLYAVIPEQVIVLDPIFSQKKDSYDGVLSRFRVILENTYGEKGVDSPLNSSAVKGEKRKISSEEEEDPIPSKKIKLDGSKEIVESRENMEETSLSQSMEVVEDESLLESKSGFSLNVSSSSSSRLALYLMRMEVTESQIMDPIHGHDFFVVNSCEVFYKDINVDFITECNKKRAERAETVLKEIKRSLTLPETYSSFSCLYQKYLKEGATQSDWKFACELMDLVGHAKEIGKSIAELREMYGCRQGLFPIARHLNILSRENIFVRVGVTTIRYVHYEYSKPWIVHSNKLLRLQREKMNPTDAKMMQLNEEAMQLTEEPVQVSETEDKSEQVMEVDELHIDHPKLVISSRNRRAIKLEGAMSPPRTMKVKSRDKILNAAGDKKEEYLGGLDWTVTDKIRIIMRPWVRVDGSLNRRVLDRFLGAVLGHILQHPGICLKEIGNRFTPALQPCHTRELVEILSSLGCIKLNVLQMKKPTLFSKPSKVSVVDPNGMEDESTVFASPQLDAASKLGAFFGDKKYSTDFLPNII